MDTDLSQTAALYLTKSEAQTLFLKVRGARFLLDRGIEVYMVSADPMPMNDGSKCEAVTVMVRAVTDKACGMGVGFLTALSEGVQR